MAACLRRFSTLVAGLLAAAAVLATGAGARPADTVNPTLYVQYALNCTFTITNDAGQAVTTIPPGAYQVQITTPVVFADVDLSNTHDLTACKSFVQFQITGPGVDLATTLQDGDEDYGNLPATFQPGATYTAVDLNQPSVARIVFQTASSGAPVTPTAPYSSTPSGKGTTDTDIVGSGAKTQKAGTPAPLRGVLTGAVSATGKVTLTSKGRAVTSLRTGRYMIVVSDASRKSGFVIQQTHRAATDVSGNAFTGKKTVTLDLRVGQWFFYPTFIGHKTYFIVTS